MKVKIKTVTFVMEEPLPYVTNNPSSAFKVARELFADLDGNIEHMMLIALNARNRVTGFKVLSTGTKTFCPVSVDQVLRTAVALDAVSFILVHNHPSGDPTPSDDDIALTKKVMQACAYFDTKLADHLILGEDWPYSIRAKLPEMWRYV